MGPFIASYEGIEVSPILVDFYVKIVEENCAIQNDNDVVYHCAYNFPAVLYTLGASSWPKLKDSYKLMVSDSRWKVRRTLSYSFHEVCKILGSDITENELLNDLEMFLTDINEVKEGVSSHLPEFV